MGHDVNQRGFDPEDYQTAARMGGLSSRPKLVYDIGMNNGDDTAYYLHKGYDVIAVEADFQLVEAAERRFVDEIKSGRLIVLYMGIGDGSKDTETFYRNSHDVWSSFDKTLGTRGGSYKEEAIRMFTLDEIVNKHREPHYLKIDIEGYDHIALQSLAGIEFTPEYISVESPDKSMLLHLFEHGYTRFKIVNQRTVSSMKDGDYQFPHGSSGPFGEDLPGSWMTVGEMETHLSQYWDEEKWDHFGDHWFDLHAAKSKTLNTIEIEGRMDNV